MSPTRYRRSRFPLHWILANTVSYAMGFFGGFILGHAMLGNVAVGLGIGAGVAVAQSLVLRSRISSKRLWILAAIVGHGIAHTGFVSLASLAAVPADLSWPAGVAMWGITIAMGGAITACLQCKLFSSSLRYPWGWITINTFAWGICVFGLAIPPDMSGGWSAWMIPVLILRNGLLAPAVAGLILGVFSSIYWLLDRDQISMCDPPCNGIRKSSPDKSAALPNASMNPKHV